ncbi:MAG: serine--tRNA ligase [Candidatus Helarchaeota archaeon]
MNKVEKYKQYIIQRRAETIISYFEKGLEKYTEWKKRNLELQKLRERLNKLSREYNQTKNTDLIKESKKVKYEIQQNIKKVRELEDEIKKIELLLPNWLLEDVPIGYGEEHEKPIKYIEKPKVWEKNRNVFEQMYPNVKYNVISFEPYHHYNLVGKLIDQEKAGNIAISRFYYLFDELVHLDLAISMYAIEFFKNKGYDNKLMITPYLMRRNVEEKITYFEAFEDTIFEIEKDNLLLIPSSEHSIIAYYEDTIFYPEDLPIRIIAWTPCFRREAGAHGKDTKGIFRVRQFHKVELHSILKKDEDIPEIYRNTDDVQEFLQSLGLPNRAVIVPTGDMDKRALIQIDVETWFPAQNKYRETHSIATLGTWVSEKLKLRYRLPKRKKELVRNVYATGVAVERLICAIVENHYDPDTETIKIPRPLQKYTMGIKEIYIGN